MILMGKQGSSTHYLRDLMARLEERLQDFKAIITGLDRKVIRKLQRYRKQGNVSTHRITLDVTEEDLLEEQEEITYCTKFLFRLYRNIP